MSSGRLHLDEANLVRLMVPFLEWRGLHCSAAVLERESGCGAARYSEPLQCLRSALLRGRWSEARELLLGLLPEAEARKALFEVSRQKYVELLCIYQELGNELFEDLGNAVAVCFSELSGYCEDPEVHEKLRELASRSRLEEDPLYRNWNPFSSRKECFEKIRCILEGASQKDCSEQSPTPLPERLWSLLVKGVLYEACEEYCRRKALARSNSEVKFKFGSLMFGPCYDSESPRAPEYDAKWLSRSKMDCDEDCENSKIHVASDTNELDPMDCSLFSWLQTVPWMSLTKDFVQFPLTVEVKKFETPRWSDGWTESILEGMDHTAEYQDVKEKFWNEKISKNLIVDAPEILKRAEEVVKRWESKHRMQDWGIRDGLKGEGENYLRAGNELGDKIDRATSTGRKDLSNGDNRDTESKPSRARSIFTSCELRGTNALNRSSYISLEGKKSFLLSKGCDRNIEENFTQLPSYNSEQVDNDTNVSLETIGFMTNDNSRDYGKKLKIPNSIKEKNMKGDCKLLLELPEELGAHTNVDVAVKTHETKGQQENIRALKTVETFETQENRDAKISREHSFSNDPNSYKNIVSLKNEITEIQKHLNYKQPTTDDEFDKIFSQDHPNENFMKTGVSVPEPVGGNTNKGPDGEHISLDLVDRNFFERKRYITQMLRDKEIQRINLLQILQRNSEEDCTYEKEAIPFMG